MRKMLCCSVVIAVASVRGVMAASSRPSAFLVKQGILISRRQTRRRILSEARRPTPPADAVITTTVVRGGATAEHQQNEENANSSTKNEKSASLEDTNTTGTSDSSAIEKAVPPLRYLGDARLMQKQTPVTEQEMNDPKFASQLEMLRRAMKEYGGIGIAAPQVGWWTRVFIFGIEGGVNPRYPQSGEIPLSFWINPEITWSSEENNYMWEGCLSVPGMRGWVERPAKIILKGINEHGQACEEHLDGLPARVAQHELDHLDGILFPARVTGTEYLVPQASIEAREGWAYNWPSRGSRNTMLGQLSYEK